MNGNTISGIRGSAISFLLDGVDVSEQHQGGTFIQTSIDALQEFSVQQSPYSAEFNRGGAFFNATTKSGTNRYHGGIFEFIRNEKLDARNYFSATRAILKRNQFGGDIGGPLSIPHLYNGRDKTFFFVDYEGQRLRQGLVVNSIVPTDAQRTGDFTGLGKPIYDPVTTSTTTANGVTTTTRNQISCNGVLNVICPSRPVGGKALCWHTFHTQIAGQRAVKAVAVTSDRLGPGHNPHRPSNRQIQPPFRALDLCQQSRDGPQCCAFAKDRVAHVQRLRHCSRSHHKYRVKQSSGLSGALSAQPCATLRIPAGA